MRAEKHKKNKSLKNLQTWTQVQHAWPSYDRQEWICHAGEDGRAEITQKKWKRIYTELQSIISTDCESDHNLFSHIRRLSSLIHQSLLPHPATIPLLSDYSLTGLAMHSVPGLHYGWCHYG
tara:strand:+ start:182 stop:544 length:363 start_codon:yes stop_codon:yes gene_type:complete